MNKNIIINMFKNIMFLAAVVILIEIITVSYLSYSDKRIERKPCFDGNNIIIPIQNLLSSKSAKLKLLVWDYIAKRHTIIDDNQKYKSLIDAQNYLIMDEIANNNKVPSIIDDSAPDISYIDFYSLNEPINGSKLLYAYTRQALESYELVVTLYDLKNNTVTKRVTIPWSGEGLPQIAVGGKNAFLFYSAITIIDLTNEKVNTIEPQYDPWPLNASQNGKTAVWLQKDESGQKAVIYDVMEEKIVSEIPLATYGGGVQSFALSAQSPLLAVGYQRSLKEDPMIVIYNYENRKKIRTLKITKYIKY